MSKLVKLNTKYWPLGGYGHWCPGCGWGHEINVATPNAQGAKWSFNGDPLSPTFTPSVHHRWGRYVDQVEAAFNGVCHYFIRSGMIEFCGDCTHELRGKTVELPDIPRDKYVSCERL